MEVLQFLRTTRYFISLTCINIASLPSLPSCAENMAGQQSPEQEHRLVSVLEIQMMDYILHRRS